MKKLHFYNNEIKFRTFSIFFSFFFTFFTVYNYSNEYIWLLTKCLWSAMSIAQIPIPEKNICASKNVQTENLLYDTVQVENVLLLKGLQFQCTEISEAFQTYLYLSFGISFYFLFPLCVYHVFCFFAPGFYSFERNYWKKVFILLCFITYLALFFGLNEVLPQCWNFFSNFEIHTSILNIQLEARILNTIEFILKIIVLSEFFFQFPFFFYFFLKFKKIKANSLSKNRKYFYLCILFISSLLAPADFFIQIISLLITTLFLESFLFLSFILEALDKKILSFIHITFT